MNIVQPSSADFVGIGIKEDGKLKFSTYHLPSRAIIMSGYFTDSTLSIRDGLFTYYDSLGFPESEGLYKNNLEEGYWLSWKGRLSDSTFYEKGVELIKISFTYHEGSDKLQSRTLDDNKKNTGETLFWDTSGLLLSKTIRIKKDEETHYFYSNGKVKEIERRPFGQQPSSGYYSQTGKDITNEVLKEREKDELGLTGWPNGGNKPAYPGGRKEFFDFIRRNLKLPARYVATTGGTTTSTLIMISFMLDKAGNAKDVEVNAVINDMKIEVASVIGRMPSWKMNGLKSYGPINISLNISVTYW